MIITVDDIMRRKPCSEYLEERVRELIGPGKTPSEILDLPIPPEDRLWVILHPDIMSHRDLCLFACDCADRTLARLADPSQTSLDAVATARRYANGEATEEELRNAHNAATCTAYTADAAYAAYTLAYAAHAAATYTAYAADAAWANPLASARAAYAAANAAAYATDAHAARAAEREWQINHVRRYL